MSVRFSKIFQRRWQKISIVKKINYWKESKDLINIYCYLI